MLFARLLPYDLAVSVPEGVIPAASSVADFYDAFGGDYHLVYGDQWEAAVERQADSTRYRAVGRAALTSAAADAGFVDIAWLDTDAAAWHQPVMTAHAA